MKFKNLDEFFVFYERDCNTAFQCFHSSEFILWLRELGYEAESELYKRCKLNNSPVMALQNFLQLLDYDVVPILQVIVENDTLILRNKGKGYIYGKLQCDKGVDTDSSEWGIIKGETRILCRGSGKVHIVSNGGCKTLYVQSKQRLYVPIEKEYKEINMEKLLQKNIRVKSDFYFPKIVMDNQHIKCCCNEKHIIIEKNIPYFTLIMKKLKHINMFTNVKLIYPEKIVHIKVKVS